MDQEQGKPRPRLQRSYELLGAPSLLFRQESTSFVEPFQGNDATSFQEYLRARKRAQVRWYHPLDHLAMNDIPEVLQNDLRMALGIKKGSGKAEPVAGNAAIDVDGKSSTDSGDEVAEEGSTRTDASEVASNRGSEASEQTGTGPAAASGGSLRNQQKSLVTTSEQSLSFLQKSRAPMIVVSDNMRAEKRGHVKRFLDTNGAYDATFVPGRMKTVSGYRLNSMLAPTRRLPGTQRHKRERQDYSDPAYLAPFSANSLKEVMADDTSTAAKDDDGQASTTLNRRRQTHAILKDDPESPTEYGNCLAVLACTCSSCKGKRSAHSVCLLHPVGQVLDRVRLSFISLPCAVPRTTPADCPELDVGDIVRQITQCTPEVFVVRTRTCVVIIRVTMVAPPTPQNTATECCGTAELHEVQRIDARSMSPHTRSYFPRDLTAHPKYGIGWTDPKIAILYESDRQERNIIHHASLGSSLRTSEHAITNLHSIFNVDFSSQHPMVLWAAARSYVRPVITADLLVAAGPKQFRSGHGSSLFSIDLRCNQATFQWSPSAEEFVTEGIHSVSGIKTDWTRENTVWASSVSAGKTWEIDTRMPCRAINVWSLPGHCEDADATLPETGLHGAGTLYAQPFVSTDGDPTLMPRPMLSVGQSPGTFGLHLYQRPDTRPRFQTQSCECASSPSLQFFGQLSAATSSVYGLPDVSKGVFTCGLAAFRTSAFDFLSADSLRDLGYSAKDVSDVICSVSMTNKGDLYTHSLLESNAGYSRSRIFDGLPIGASNLSIPDSAKTGALAPDSSSLPVSLLNNCPLPSHAIFCPDPPSCKGIAISDQSKSRTDAPADPPQRIRPKAGCHMVVVSQEGKGGDVHLPRRLLRVSKESRASTVEYFHHQRESAAESDKTAQNQLRSDVTTDIMSFGRADSSEDELI